MTNQRLHYLADDKIAADLHDACEHMDPMQLTEHQKFAIAVAVGVPCTPSYSDGRLTIETVPCAVVVVSGRWLVLLF